MKNSEDLIKYHKSMCDKMCDILKRKNADYTGDSKDPFNNFTLIEKSNIAKTEIGILVRMTDKMARITSFVNTGVLRVKDESIEDTLVDLANYSIILAAYIKHIKTKKGGKND